MSAPTIFWIRGGVGFAPEAAASWQRMEAQRGKEIQTNSTYRDYATQMRMYLAWKAWVERRGPRPNHGYAAHPDSSDHCKGVAADSNESTALDALFDANGWLQTDASESWHRAYRRSSDRHYGQGAGGGSNPFDPSEEDEMNADQSKWLSELHAVVVSGSRTNPSIATVAANIYKEHGKTLAELKQILTAVNDGTAGSFDGIGTVVAASHKILLKLEQRGAIDTDAIVKGVLAGLPEGTLSKADVSDAVAEALNNLTLRSVAQ